MLVSGNGVTRDLARGTAAIAKAKEAGVPAAIFNAGWIAAFGRPEAVDAGGAAKLFVSSIKAGSREAAERLLEAAPRLGKALRESIQAELKAAATYTGAVDGRFGAGTRRALYALAGSK